MNVYKLNSILIHIERKTSSPLKMVNTRQKNAFTLKKNEPAKVPEKSHLWRRVTKRKKYVKKKPAQSHHVRKLLLFKSHLIYSLFCSFCSMFAHNVGWFWQPNTMSNDTYNITKRTSNDSFVISVCRIRHTRIGPTSEFTCHGFTNMLSTNRKKCPLSLKRKNVRIHKDFTNFTID